MKNLAPIVVMTCRLVLGGVFIYASWDKLMDPAGFAQNIHHYRMVPYAPLHPFALFLPMLEMVVGVALILGVHLRGAALLTLLLNVMFIVAISTALVRGLDISCGCFNTDGGHAVGLSLLVRDFLLLLACLPPLLFQRVGPTLSRSQKY